MENFDLRNLLNPEHWLAMDADEVWFVYKDKPFKIAWSFCAKGDSYEFLPKEFFNLPTCENWEESLIQVKDLIKD